jgi:hypothetical protein
MASAKKLQLIGVIMEIENKINQLKKIRADIRADYRLNLDSRLKLKIDKLTYCIIYLKTKKIAEGTIVN